MKKTALLMLAMLCILSLSACGKTDSFESWQPPEKNTEVNEVVWLPGDVYSQDKNYITTYFSNYRGEVKIKATKGYSFAIRCYAGQNYTNVIFDSGWQTGEYIYEATNGYVVVVGKKQKGISVSEGDNYGIYLENTWIGEVENAEIKGVAHRGGSGLVPECTAPAVIYTKAQGFTAAENDMRLTADGEIVVFHDATLKKLGYPDKVVAEMTLAELKEYDYGAYVSEEFAGAEILTLAEWLSLCKELDLEPWIDSKILPWQEDVTRKAVDIVRSLGMLREVKWVGATAEGSAQLRALDPEAYLVYLSAPSDSIIDLAKQYIVSAEDPRVCINSQNTALTEENAQKAVAAGIPLAFWWANAGQNVSETQVRDECERLYNLGARAMTVDNYNPERLLAIKELKPTTGITQNWLNPSVAYTASKLLDETGNEYGWGASWGVTDYIPLAANTLYTVSKEFTDNGHFNACFYDESKNLIGATGTYWGTVFTTPENCKYVRFSILLPFATKAMIVEGSYSDAEMSQMYYVAYAG